MAAGLSLPHAALDAFAESGLRTHVERVLDPALLQAEVVSDGALEAHEFDRANAECLRDGGPWGQGFPEPLVRWRIRRRWAWRVVGERHLKLTLRVPGARARRCHPLQRMDRHAAAGARAPGVRLSVDDYRGGDAIQLVVDHVSELAPKIRAPKNNTDTFAELA
jgi:single-stranded-DNA-specific exonuclease